MTTTHWNGTISLVNGSNIATVTAGDPIADIYANSDLFFDGRDRPLEVVRAYNNGSNNVFELGTNYAGSNVTVSATISPGPGSILAAAKAAQALNESAQSITGSTATSSSANTIAKRTSDGRLKAANASANDDLVPLGQLGSSAQQDVYSGTYTGNSPDTILRQGDFGFGSAFQSPVNFLPDNTHFPNSLGRDGDGTGGYPIFGWASSILNMRYNNARQSQVGISNGGLPQIAFRTMTSNDTWSGPYHLFGEHNSVNITEKGWGAASTPLIADADTLNETFIGRSSSANPTANMPTDFGSWNNSVLIHLQGANNAYSGQIAISAGGDIGVRGENGNIQNAWNEVFTSKNTNLDEFIGNGVNDVICEKGRPYSATTAIFYFDLCGTTSPTSISAVGSPTYRIVDTWGANVIASGIPHASLTFQSSSSHKVGRVAIGSLSGMTKDMKLELQIEVANTGLKFNF